MMKIKIRWLLYCLTLALMISSVTLSRYISSVSGTDTASVAGVALSGNVGTQSFSIDIRDLGPGTEKNIPFEVLNYKDGKVSQVALSYAISLESTGNLPVYYTLEKVSTQPASETMAEPWDTFLASGSNTGVETKSNGVLGFSGQTTHKYNLKIEWPQAKNDIRYSYEIDAVTVYIKSEQIS